MSVEKYRKKPVEIEAAQWDGTSFTADAIVAWSGGDVREVDPMNVADRRAFAEAVLIGHDPDHQGDTPGRCNLCGYVRHPCATFTLAEYLLQALDAADPDGKELIAVPHNDDWFDVCIQLRDHNFFLTDDHCKAAASLIEAVLRARGEWPYV